MKEVRYSIATIVLIWMCLSKANTQSLFTVEESIHYALQNHVSMRLADMKGDDAEWAYKEGLAIGLPKITLDTRYNFSYIRPKVVIEDFISPILVNVLNQTSLAPELVGFGSDSPTTVEAAFTRKHQVTAGLNMSVFVFNGNYLKGLKVGKMFMDLARKQKILTEQQIKSNVTNAFNNVIVTKKNMTTIDNNISNVDKLLKETKALYKNGFVEALDVDRLLLSKEILQSEKLKLTRLEEVSKNVLKFQMAYPLNQPIEIVENLEKDVDIILLNNIDLKDEIDLSKRPEHSLLQEAIILDEADLNRIKKAYLPSVYASASLEESLQRDGLFNSQESGWLPNGTIGLKANIPIYDGGDTRAKIQRKKIVLEKRELELSEFNRSLVLQIFNARTELINSKSNLVSAKRTLELSQKIYNKTQIKYTNGVGSSLELTQAENGLYDAQANYINSMYDILVAQSALDIATGEINDK
ncbi:MAG: TolC family protein [Saprospiraceae bacterium]